MMQVSGDRGIFFRPQQIKVLAESGDIGKAKEIVEEIKNYFEEHGEDKSRYYLAFDSIKMVASDYNLALTYFDSIPYLEKLLFSDKCLIGLANLKANRTVKAISILRDLEISYNADKAYYGILSVKIYYYLGLAYEANNEFDLAREQYSKFIDLWGRSSIPRKEVDDARNRLTKLRGIL